MPIFHLQMKPSQASASVRCRNGLGSGLKVWGLRVDIVPSQQTLKMMVSQKDALFFLLILRFHVKFGEGIRFVFATETLSRGDSKH